VSRVVRVVAAWLCVLAIVSRAQAAEPTGTPRPDFSYRYDVRPAIGNPQQLALDFHSGLDWKRESKNPQGHAFSWTASVEGSQAFDRRVTDVDHMAGEISLQGHYYRSGPSDGLPARTQVRLRDLMERDPAGAEAGDSSAAGGAPGWTKADEDELNGLTRLANANRRYFGYDVHYRFETTQDTDVHQHVFGGGLRGEVPGLDQLLDMIPWSTRRQDDTFHPQAVRAFAALEYVHDAPDSLAPAGVDQGKARYTRARLQGAWSTKVFSDLVVKVTFESDYLFDPPDAVVIAAKRFHSYTHVWLEAPVGSRTGLLLTYLDGRLPPTYANVSGGRVGLTYSFNN
jgi:hypothetical protein